MASMLNIKPKKVPSIDSYYPSMGGPAASYKIGYLTPRPAMPSTLNPSSYYPTVGGAAARNPISQEVPVQPNPKPPAASTFDLNSDPLVRNAMSQRDTSVRNAFDAAKGSILARLLQFGDPTLSQSFIKDKAQRFLNNLDFGAYGRNASNLIGLSQDDLNKITQAYGANQDEAVARDQGPSGLSTKAQFDRSVAQAWRQRLGSLTGSGAIRSGDLGYQTDQQNIGRDVGYQNLIDSLTGAIGQDVGSVGTAMTEGEKLVQQAIQTLQAAVIQNPDGYSALNGYQKPIPAPAPAAPSPSSLAQTYAATTAKKGTASNALSGAYTADQLAILKAILGGAQ
jgi:hypothetical protein